MVGKPPILYCCPEAVLCLEAVTYMGTDSWIGTMESLWEANQPYQVLKWTCRSLAGKGIFWDISTAHWKLNPCYTLVSVSVSAPLSLTHTHTLRHIDTVCLFLTVSGCPFHFCIFLWLSTLSFFSVSVSLYTSTSPPLFSPVCPFH